MDKYRKDRLNLVDLVRENSHEELRKAQRWIASTAPTTELAREFLAMCDLLREIA